MFLHKHDRVHCVLLRLAHRWELGRPVGLVLNLAWLAAVHLQMQMRSGRIPCHADMTNSSSWMHVLAFRNADSTKVPIDRIVGLVSDPVLDDDMEPEASGLPDSVHAATCDGTDRCAECEFHIQTRVDRAELAGIQVVLAEVASGIEELGGDVWRTRMACLKQCLHRRCEFRKVVAWERNKIFVHHFSVRPLPFLRRFHHAPVRRACDGEDALFEGGEVGDE